MIYNNFKAITVNDLAYFYPTESEYKIQKNQRGSIPLNSSKAHWRRIIKGEISTTNKLFLKRVDTFHKDIAYIRSHILWDILALPHASIPELRKMLQKLKPALSGKLFHSSDNPIGICYKRLYWSPNNIATLESIDALALRLILYRLSTLTSIDKRWPCDLQGTSLLLLRLISFSPLSYVADRAMKLFDIFVRVNTTNHEIEDIVHDATNIGINSTFRNVFRQILPESYPLSQEASSFNSYMQCHKGLIQNYGDKCFPATIGVISLKSFQQETLFLADRYANKWLYGDITKAQLLIAESQIIKLQPGKPQIW